LPSRRGRLPAGLGRLGRRKRDLPGRIARSAAGAAGMTIGDGVFRIRKARIERETLETRIALTVDLDGGDVRAATGVPFLDHMLAALGKHGRLGLDVTATGD